MAIELAPHRQQLAIAVDIAVEETEARPDS